MKYRLKVTVRKFVNVKGEYDYVDITNEFEFEEWEELTAFTGCLVDNCITNEFQFAIDKIEEVKA